MTLAAAGVLTKIKAEHISLFQMIIVQIIGKLFFSPCVIGITSPKLLSPSVLLKELLLLVSINLIKVYYKFFQDEFHIQMSVFYELVFLSGGFCVNIFFLLFG